MRGLVTEPATKCLMLATCHLIHRKSQEEFKFCRLIASVGLEDGRCTRSDQPVSLQWPDLSALLLTASRFSTI